MTNPAKRKPVPLPPHAARVLRAAVHWYDAPMDDHGVRGKLVEAVADYLIAEAKMRIASERDAEARRG